MAKDNSTNKGYKPQPPQKKSGVQSASNGSGTDSSPEEIDSQPLPSLPLLLASMPFVDRESLPWDEFQMGLWKAILDSIEKWDSSSIHTSTHSRLDLSSELKVLQYELDCGLLAAAIGQYLSGAEIYAFEQVSCATLLSFDSDYQPDRIRDFRLNLLFNAARGTLQRLSEKMLQLIRKLGRVDNM